MKHNPKRIIFAQRLFAGDPAQVAAQKAGYKPTPAFRTTVSELRQHPEVVAELARLKAETERQAVLARDKWMREWILDVEFDPAKFIRDDGSIDIQAAKLNGLLSRTNSVKVVETTAQDGTVTRRIEIRFPDRQTALQNIGKAEAYYAPEKHEVKHEFDVEDAVADLTPEEEAQLKEEMIRLGLYTEPPPTPTRTETKPTETREEDQRTTTPKPRPKPKPKPKRKRRAKPTPKAHPIPEGGGDTGAGEDAGAESGAVEAEGGGTPRPPSARL